LGETLSVKVVPRVEVPPGEGALGLGIAEAGFSKLPFLASVWQGLLTALNIVALIFTSLINLIVGLLTGRAPFESFVGPVGLFQVAEQTGKLGFAYLWQLIGLISLNLTVLNIFPFPALDGGRLAFIAVEKIKGSPVSQRRESLTHAIGFILLLILMIAITIKDIVRLF
jgi:regulator of sigma E protease